MKHLRLTRRQGGFTILELMIATTVFSVIMLVAAAGIVSFTNAYYKGVTSTTTQATARTLLNDITQNIQLSASSISFEGSSAAPSYCINNSIEYSSTLGNQVAPNSHGLIKHVGVTCPGTPAGPTGALSPGEQEMLGDHMRLGAFKVDVGPNSTWTVHVRVIYGDDDLLNDVGSAVSGSTDWSTEGGKINCKSGIGSQFCAVADLSTTVQVRLL